MTCPSLVRIALAACAALVVSACNGNGTESLHQDSRLMMGTLVEVTVVAPADKAKAVTEAVFEEMRRVEDLTSFHKNSLLTDINSSAGKKAVKTDLELLSLVERSLKIAGETGGAFDPTVGPLCSLWRFSGADPRLPDQAEITDALAKVGWYRVKVDRQAGTVFLPDEGMALDLGGMAKGYALDRAREVMKRMGITAGLLNAGGDIVAMGEKGPGKAWRIGVQDPRNPKGLVAVAAIRDGVIVTSGDYERFFEADGRRYHHILDPMTGYPAEGMQSVTILAADGLTADALATAGIFVMGVQRGLRHIESFPGVEGLLIDSEGRIHMTPGAAKAFELKR